MKITREQRRARMAQRRERRHDRRRFEQIELSAFERTRRLLAGEIGLIEHHHRFHELCDQQQRRGLRPAEVTELLDLLEMGR